MEAPPVGGHRTGGGGPDGSHAVDWGTRLRASTKAKARSSWRTTAGFMQLCILSFMPFPRAYLRPCNIDKYITIIKVTSRM